MKNLSDIFDIRRGQGFKSVLTKAKTYNVKVIKLISSKANYVLWDEI